MSLCDPYALMAEQDRNTLERHSGKQQFDRERIAEPVCMPAMHSRQVKATGEEGMTNKRLQDIWRRRGKIADANRAGQLPQTIAKASAGERSSEKLKH